MTIRDAKEIILDIVEMFFSGANIALAQQSRSAKPKMPLVVVSFGNTHRVQHPPTTEIDGHLVSYYPTSVTAQIDLYTKGLTITNTSKGVIGMENTALSDMVDFANFIGSAYFQTYADQKNISISQDGNVMDTTHLLNQSDYQFRATKEISLHFIHESIGYSGILDHSSLRYPSSDEGDSNENTEGGSPNEDEEASTSDDVTIVPEFTQNSSGGGNEEIAIEELGYFTESETEEIIE